MAVLFLLVRHHSYLWVAEGPLEVATDGKLNRPEQIVLFGDCIVAHSPLLLNLIANHFDEFINRDGSAALEVSAVFALFGNVEENRNLFEFEIAWQPRKDVLGNVLPSRFELGLVPFLQKEPPGIVTGNSGDFVFSLFHDGFRNPRAAAGRNRWPDARKTTHDRITGRLRGARCTEGPPPAREGGQSTSPSRCPNCRRRRF